MNPLTILSRLREHYSVTITDTALGWSLVLRTVGEDNEIDEHHYNDRDLETVIRRAWKAVNL